MTKTLYNNNQPQPCIQMISERVPGGEWSAVVRAVIRCGSSSNLFMDTKPRVIIQWGARVNDSMPQQLYSISQYAKLDPSIMTADGIGSVCLALFGDVPAHMDSEEVMLGKTCLITVGRDGVQKNRVIAHSALLQSHAAVMLPDHLKVHGDICDLDPIVFAKLDLPPSMRNARLKIAQERGMI